MVVTEYQSHYGDSPDTNFNSEMKASTDQQSEEGVESFHADPAHPNRVLRIGMRLSNQEKNIKFLSENLDIFA